MIQNHRVETENTRGAKPDNRGVYKRGGLNRLHPLGTKISVKNIIARRSICILTRLTAALLSTLEHERQTILLQLSLFKGSLWRILSISENSEDLRGIGKTYAIGILH